MMMGQSNEDNQSTLKSQSSKALIRTTPNRQVESPRLFDVEPREVVVGALGNDKKNVGVECSI